MQAKLAGEMRVPRVSSQQQGTAAEGCRPSALEPDLGGAAWSDHALFTEKAD